jgi:hypothetical protein
MSAKRLWQVRSPTGVVIDVMTRSPGGAAQKAAAELGVSSPIRPKLPRLSVLPSRPTATGSAA